MRTIIFHTNLELIGELDTPANEIRCLQHSRHECWNSTNEKTNNVQRQWEEDIQHTMKYLTYDASNLECFDLYLIRCASMSKM